MYIQTYYNEFANKSLQLNHMNEDTHIHTYVHTYTHTYVVKDHIHLKLPRPLNEKPLLQFSVVRCHINAQNCGF